MQFDRDQVFIKTSLGDEAVQQRTRIVQRNLRMVLILVDGHSTVADLETRAGNPDMVDDALAELLEGGYIRHINDDGTMASRPQPPASAAFSVAEMTLDGPSTEVPWPIFEESQSSEIEGFQVPSPVPAPSSFPEMEQEKAEKNVGGKRLWPWQKPKAKVRAEKQPSAPSPSGTTVPAMKLSRRQLRWALLAVVLTLPLGLLVWWAMQPWGDYARRTGAAWSAALGQPVLASRAALDFSGLGARVGPLSGPLQIDTLFLSPVWGTESTTAPRWKAVAIEGMRLPLDGLKDLPAWTKSLLEGHPAVAVDLRNVYLGLGDGLSLSPLAGRLQLAGGGALQRSVLRAESGLTVTLLPSAEGLVLELEAPSWQAPMLDKIQLDGFKARVDWVAPKVVRLSSLETRALGGLVTGEVMLDLSANRPGGTSRLDLKSLDFDRLLKALKVPLRAEGAAYGALQGDAAGVVLDIKMERGRLNGFDVVEALRALGRPVQGGDVRFESLQGRLRVSADGAELSDIILVSGLMQTTGTLRFAGGQVSGTFRVSLKTQAGEQHAVVAVSGPVETPSLLAR